VPQNPAPARKKTSFDYGPKTYCLFVQLFGKKFLILLKKTRLPHTNDL